jgi:hypothetical protein
MRIHKQPFQEGELQRIDASMNRLRKKNNPLLCNRLRARKGKLRLKILQFKSMVKLTREQAEYLRKLEEELQGLEQQRKLEMINNG